MIDAVATLQDGKTAPPLRVTVTYVKRQGQRRAIGEQVGRLTPTP